MSRIRDLSGQRFGRLTAVSRGGSKIYGGQRFTTWICVCDCGASTTVVMRSLVTGTTRSCGCLGIESRITHGRWGTPTHHTWHSMVARCTNPKSPSYRWYGALGIVVCAEWMTFDGFLSDMGERPKGTTLDRIDVNGHYQRDNCRWADVKQQARNKTTNVNITYGGETFCVSEWAERLGVKPRALMSRLDMGWTHDRVIETPVKVYRRKSA